MANQNQGQGSSKGGQSERGFAAMSDSQQREAARKGGEAVSEDREHMAEIGRKGGEASAQSREGSSQGAQQARSRSDDADSASQAGKRGGNQESSGSSRTGSSNPGGDRRN